jgi:hypothetical protein
VTYAPAGRETLAAITDDLLPAAARAPVTSAPDVKIGLSPAGRSTLEAIQHELSPVMTRNTSMPDLEFQLMPAGRETLQTIAAEVAGGGPEVRAPMSTLDYDERSRARAEPDTGVRRAKKSSRPPKDGAQPAGRDTLDAIANAVLNEPAAPSSSARARMAVLDVFELVTFVVRGEDVSPLASEGARREFVAERLLHRLPVPTMDQIDRVDVSPGNQRGTVLLRVWCKVRAPRH